MPKILADEPERYPEPASCKITLKAVWDNGEKVTMDFVNIAPTAPAELIGEIRARRNTTEGQG